MGPSDGQDESGVTEPGRQSTAGTAVNSIVMAVRGARWVRSNRGGHFLNDVNV